MGTLLQEYGYRVVSDPHREQQFACDLHGPDNKPSARFYGQTNSFHCFACAKSRDCIQFVIDKEQVPFKQAIEILERRLNLPAMGWEDEDENPQDSLLREFDQISNPTVSFESDQKRVQHFLCLLTQDRELESDSLLKFWEVFDRIEYHVHQNHWDEAKGTMALKTLHVQVMERLKARSVD
jgi:hypothetical protein